MSKNSSKVSNENKQNKQGMLLWTKLAQKWILGSEFQKSTSESESALPRYQFSGKTNNFEFFNPKVAQKLIFRSEFQKSKCGFGISTSKISCVPIFRQNGLFWFFSAQISSKMDLRLEIQKINVRTSINILKIPREPIFRLNKIFWLFRPKCPKMAFGITISKI